MIEPPKPPIPRTLERDIPELKAYLWPGAQVLDIGCGSGTITLDVAAAVCPGEAIGVDPDDGQVKVAREWLTQHPGAGNVSFQVADSHALDFPDNKFDLVYSHTVVHFLLDPVAALKEQKRVTKPGGWAAPPTQGSRSEACGGMLWGVCSATACLLLARWWSSSPILWPSWAPTLLRMTIWSRT